MQWSSVAGDQFGSKTSLINIDFIELETGLLHSEPYAVGFGNLEVELLACWRS